MSSHTSKPDHDNDTGEDVIDVGDLETVRRRQNEQDMDDARFISELSKISDAELEERDLDIELLMQARELLRRQREEELERKKKNEATNPSRGSPETSSRTPNEETTDSMTDGGKAPTASDQDQPASTGADESTAEEITEDHPQWKAFMKIREMVKNGSASPDEYMWCQDKHSVTLNVILPKGTLGKHVQVLLEDGWFVIVLKNREGAPFFRKKLAYPVVLEKEHAQPRAGLGAGGEDNLDDVLLKTGDLALQKYLAESDQTYDLDGYWEIWDLEGDEMEHRRRLEITFYKMAPQGLVMWWKRAFVGEDEIDLTTIADRSRSKAVTLIPGIGSDGTFSRDTPDDQMNQLEAIEAEKITFGEHIGNVVQEIQDRLQEARGEKHPSARDQAATAGSVSSSTEHKEGSGTSRSKKDSIVAKAIREQKLPLSWWARTALADYLPSQEEIKNGILNQPPKDGQDQPTMKSVWDIAHERFREEVRKRKPIYITNEGEILDMVENELAEMSAEGNNGVDGFECDGKAGASNDEEGASPHE